MEDPTRRKLDLEELEHEVRQYVLANGTHGWIKMRTSEMVELIVRIRAAEDLVLRMQKVKEPSSG